MNVHQVLSGAGPYDAVTTQALAFRDLFATWGWGGRDVAAEIDPRIGHRIAPLRSLAAAGDDLLLIHYSAYAPKLRAVLELPQRKLLISHNITPARWFWDHDPQAAVVCALGRKQLPQFAAAVDVAAGVSLYNARELGSETVIPILFDPAALGAAGPPDPPGPPTVLFVGRLAPHKRQDAVIRAFELYRRRHAPDARLVLVGAPINWAYDAVDARARRRALARPRDDRVRAHARAARGALALGARVPLPLRARGLLHPGPGGLPLRRAGRRARDRRRAGGRSATPGCCSATTTARASSPSCWRSSSATASCAPSSGRGARRGSRPTRPSRPRASCARRSSRSLRDLRHTGRIPGALRVF